PVVSIFTIKLFLAALNSPTSPRTNNFIFHIQSPGDEPGFSMLPLISHLMIQMTAGHNTSKFII
ncbi:hypothetical protein RCU60_17450, partial [Escherichia coli]|nr:hypothetical protein [Escherichia coli]